MTGVDRRLRARQHVALRHGTRELRLLLDWEVAVGVPLSRRTAARQYDDGGEDADNRAPSENYFSTSSSS